MEYDLFEYIKRSKKYQEQQQTDSVRSFNEELAFT